jgi:alpha-L-fucosidase
MAFFKYLITLALTVSLSGFAKGQSEPYPKSKQQNMEWFLNAKFGLFVHWGLYSQAAGLWKGHQPKGGEHFMLYERIPVKEYAQIANDFNPTGFNAEQWVNTLKQAGMRYIVFTTKHHEGFAMYNSQCSDYNIVTRTPFKRDPLKELAAACKKADIKLGLYYSLGRDWEDPDVPTCYPVKAGRSNTWDFPDEDGKVLSRYIERKVKPQLKELLTGYGEIAMLWFDTPELITREQSEDLINLIHSLQPQCLINNRVGNDSVGKYIADYNILEQELSSEIRTKPWEACITMSKNWGYNQFDTIYKSPEMIIRHLSDVVSKGGNFLLNVGPTDKGVLPKRSFAVFNGLHEWLKINGEAIYGTHPWRISGEVLNASYKDMPEAATNSAMKDVIHDATPKGKIPDIRYTVKGNCLYVIARSINQSDFILKALRPDDNIKSIELLGQKAKVAWSFSRNGLQINIPKLQKQPIPVYVLKIKTKA